MTKILNEVNPPLEEALAHFGVKGMHWGVRRELTGRTTTSADIKKARQRTDVQKRQINTHALRAIATRGSPNPKAAKKAEKDFYQAQAAYLRNPDRATALRMTAGEKAAAAFIGVFAPGPGTAITVGYVAARVATRKAVESELQELNGKK